MVELGDMEWILGGALVVLSLWVLGIERAMKYAATQAAERETRLGRRIDILQAQLSAATNHQLFRVGPDVVRELAEKPPL